MYARAVSAISFPILPFSFHRNLLWLFGLHQQKQFRIVGQAAKRSPLACTYRPAAHSHQNSEYVKLRNEPIWVSTFRKPLKPLRLRQYAKNKVVSSPQTIRFSGNVDKQEQPPTANCKKVKLRNEPNGIIFDHNSKSNMGLQESPILYRKDVCQ